MCDYSLHNVAPGKGRRQAGDYKVRLSHARFCCHRRTECGSVPSSRHRSGIESEVERDHPFGRLLPNMQFGNLGDKVARFRQVNMDRPNTHHDALEFPNGQIVLVTRLCEGQRATVLQLPAPPCVTRESQEQMHVSPVA
jgi:hypothetical protein